MMRWGVGTTLVGIVVFLCCCNGTQHTFVGAPANHQTFCFEGDTLLIWSDSVKLTMSDFRGPPNDSIRHRVVAVSNVGVCSSPYLNGYRLEANLYAVFDRYRSWSDPFIEADSLETLNHEQRHFDLEEVERRMVIKELLDLQTEPFTLADQWDLFGSAIFFIGWDFGTRNQDNYDLETRHGTNEAEQKRWDKKIDSLLWVTREYTGTFISLPVTDTILHKN